MGLPIGGSVRPLLAVLADEAIEASPLLHKDRHRSRPGRSSAMLSSENAPEFDPNAPR